MIDAAIVGLGRWGRVLVDGVQGRSEKIRFTRAVTRSPAKAAEYCRANGIALGDDLDAALSDPAIGAVVIATPHTQHRDQIIAAARAGKHVFVEKPFTLTRASAEEAMAACRAAPVVVAIGHNRRFWPSTCALADMAQRGALGALLHVEGNFSVPMKGPVMGWRAAREESPGGGLTSLGIHVIDAVLQLCGPVAEVRARSVRLTAGEIDDATSALLSFESGATGYIGTLTATPRLYHVRLFGETGWAELSDPEALRAVMRDGADETVRLGADDSIRAELEAFAVAAEGGRAYPITPEEIVHGTAVLEAIVTAAVTGSAVRP